MTKPVEHQLHLNLASSFQNLERAVEEAESFMATMTNDEDLAYRVVLLTSEAVTNAMEHGNKWDPHKQVTLDLEATEKQVELCVCDEGEGFEPDSVNDPLADENLMTGRGRGLYFMEQMANEVHVEKEGRLLRLVFYRTP